MQYNAQTRREIKKAARAQVQAHIGRCIAVRLLYTVPYILLGLLLYLAAFRTPLRLLAAGAYYESMMAFALSRGANTAWLIGAVTLVLSGPLGFGLMRFYIGLHRGEEAEVSQLWQPFTARRSLWAGVRMGFALFARQLLRLLLPTVLVCGVVLTVVFAAIFAGGALMTDWNAAFTAMCALYLLALFLIWVRLLADQSGWVLLREDERRGAWDAARDGASAFRGHYGSLVGFVLSFAGWYVLAAALGGLCMLLALGGLYFLSGGIGVAVFAASQVAWLCISVLLGGYFGAYFRVSLVGLFEHFAARTDRAAAPQDETD